jgi:hypothetical protein|tara:strand:+ start:2257 stop:2475 length:219 start_codon:yes stop_codon:yes gene_type:complete
VAHLLNMVERLLITTSQLWEAQPANDLMVPPLWSTLLVTMSQLWSTLLVTMSQLWEAMPENALLAPPLWMTE